MLSCILESDRPHEVVYRTHSGSLDHCMSNAEDLLALSDLWGGEIEA